MNTLTFTKKLCLHSVILGCALALTACGGGGGGGDKPAAKKPQNPSGQVVRNDSANAQQLVPTDVAGLSLNKTSYDSNPLFYTQVAPPVSDAGLYNIKDHNSTPVKVDTRIGQSFYNDLEANPPVFQTISQHHASFMAIPGTSAGLDDYHQSGVFYTDGKLSNSIGYHKTPAINFSSGSSVLKIPVSSSSMAPQFINSIWLYDLESSNNSCMLSQLGQICLSMRPNDNITALPNGFDYFDFFAPVVEGSKGIGYLAINKANNSELVLVDKQGLTPNPSPVLLKGSTAAIDDVQAAAPLGISTEEGSQYLAVKFNGEQNFTVWLYTTGAGSGSMAQVKNNGAPLIIEPKLVNPTQPALPEAKHIARINLDFYFFRSQVSQAGQLDLIKLSGYSWENLRSQPVGSLFNLTISQFLTAVNQQLVFEELGKVIALDPTNLNETVLDNSSDQFINGVGANSQQWLFYNRFEGQNNKPFAVALNPATLERVDIPNWRWVGNTISRELQPATLLSNQLSTAVFLLSDNYELAAVDANNPSAGKVNFGKLPENANDIFFFGTAPGVRRLAQTMVGQTNGDPSFQVIYLDVTDSQSLKTLTPLSQEPLQRPVTGF